MTQPVPAVTSGQVTLVANDEVWLRVYDANNETLFLHPILVSFGGSPLLVHAATTSACINHTAHPGSPIEAPGP